MAQTARISNRSDAIITEMASLTGQTKVEVIELALETYRREQKMQLFNEGYRKLRSDKEAWNEELKERKEWEGTIGDGIEEE
jgi:hypothetical protein